MLSIRPVAVRALERRREGVGRREVHPNPRAGTHCQCRGRAPHCGCKPIIRASRSRKHRASTVCAPGRLLLNQSSSSSELEVVAGRHVHPGPHGRCVSSPPCLHSTTPHNPAAAPPPPPPAAACCSRRSTPHTSSCLPPFHDQALPWASPRWRSGCTTWECQCWTLTRWVQGELFLLLCSVSRPLSTLPTPCVPEPLPGPPTSLMQVVHELYSPGGAAVAVVDAAFPGVAVDGGGLDGGVVQAA